MPKPGYIYVATDGELPGHCKVGKTIDVEQRERTLNGSKMKATIKIVDSVWVDDMDTVEQAFHKILNHRRGDGDGNREWFNIEKDDVLPMLKCVARPAERPARFEDGQADRVGEPGGWHEAGWKMHCGGKTQAEIAEKFGVSQGTVAAMKKKMRSAGRGNEEESRLQPSIPEQVGNKRKQPSGPTHQSAFRKPIVEVLKELGGSGKTKDVIERVGQRMEGQLSRADHEHGKSGQIVWKNKVQWERMALKDEGILKSNSPHGLWELA